MIEHKHYATNHDFEILKWVVAHNGDGILLELKDQSGNIKKYWSSSLDYRARTEFIRKGYLYRSNKVIKSVPQKCVIIRGYDIENLPDGERTLFKGGKNYIVFGNLIKEETARKYGLELIER